uniref:Uncharacterized protein n=1 Tax=Setaria viridis TaxID=4556 RepID=A0A4U6VJE8_SETVI|nr:hypothetical protein SEVIR_3G268800v2 [Setaria viridis]
MANFSYFRIKALEERESNVTRTTERLCPLNQHDMDVFGQTLVAMSFYAILARLLDVLNYSYTDGKPIRTRDLKLQAHLTFYRPFQLTSSPLFEIYGSACDHPCEALESTLIHALVYIDKVLGFTIGDLSYVAYLHK